MYMKSDLFVKFCIFPYIFIYFAYIACLKKLFCVKQGLNYTYGFFPLFLAFYKWKREQEFN
jgi:hypothetical protein